ncbi:hypothetical protein CA267_010525 [Alteromonas pelagimontana]|uniref:ATP-grasp fold RimK-type domain-containing protein n=1 Tax=Alteromonas pelagimontana TaxID=1858656 RepID=A0A6M4MDI4_9ALTE|nr:hypothetical protein [Alteromonas pelagimontana]QJR81183.1 hypothetical protein CA267_010525 [Alteromonas pelagimontana]
MSSVAFLSMDSLEGFHVYDDLLIAPFARAGWQVETVSWRRNVDWNQYDVVIVRSPWDYQQTPEAFIRCLREIEASSAKLENPLGLMLWNIRKTYLKDLEKQGIAVVPTFWGDNFHLPDVQQQFAAFGTDEIIIKPTLSANADDTFRLNAKTLVEQQCQLTALFKERAFMVQPFIREIVEEGEYSLFYFSGQYSHAILKQPKAGDFRVQEEHGGVLTSIEPLEDMKRVAVAALKAMPTDHLYARVDLVRSAGKWALMELELIEPSLYFNLDIASPQRFVDAFVERYGRGH